MKQKFAFLGALLTFITMGLPVRASSDFQAGITAGVSSGNTQAPAAVYDQISFMGGIEASFGVTSILRLGGFWDYNNLSAKDGQPSPFNHGGVSGPLHFFGILARVLLDTNSNWFLDGKFGYNSRSIGAPPAPSDVGPGVGIALGYNLVRAGNFTLSPRIGYRILSYNVNTVADYAHKSADFNVLLSYNF